MTAPFRPARFLPGRHLQTIFGPLFRKPPALRLTRERWELPDGDFLDVDRLADRLDHGPAQKLDHGPGPQREGKPPLLVVLHGLEGSSSSHYMRGLLAQAQARGFRGLALNFRGCSGEQNRLLRSYHSGETGDLAHCIARICDEEPDVALLLAGCSLGGNVLVKWLGEGQVPPNVRAAAALSVPFDLALCARTLDGPGLMSFVYRTRFLRTLKRKAREKARSFPQGFDASRVERAQTLGEFDEALTGPVHGFAGAEDYWSQSSSGPYVARVRVPLLLVSAQDDPFIPPSCLPREAARENKQVTLEVQESGGHLGFIEGSLLRPRFYLERRAVQFLAEQLLVFRVGSS